MPEIKNQYIANQTQKQYQYNKQGVLISENSNRQNEPLQKQNTCTDQTTGNGDDNDQIYGQKLSGIFKEPFIRNRKFPKSQPFQFDPNVRKMNFNKREALHLIEQNRLEEALVVIDEAIKKDSSNPRNYELKSNVLLFMNRLTESLEFAEKAIKMISKMLKIMQEKLTYYYSSKEVQMLQNPDEYEFEVGKANALLHLNKFDECQASYDVAIQKSNNKPEIYSEKANALRIQKHKDALISYGKAIELDSQQPSFHSGKAHTLQEMNRFEEALLEWQKAIDLEPSNSNYYSGRAYTLRQLNRNEEAVISYDLAIQRNPQNYEHHSGKAYSLRQLQRNIEAIDSFDSAISLYADDAYIYAQKKLSNVSNKLLKNPEDYEYFIHKADTLRAMNKAKEALDSYNQAIQRFPQDERIYGAKGITSSENYDEALKYFDKAIQMNPENPSFYAGKGDTLRDLNRYQDCLKYFDQAIHYHPENSFYYGAKADALRHLDQFDEALKYANLAINWNPNLADNYELKANILKFQLKIDEALKNFDKAIKINPEPSKYYAEKADTLRAVNRNEEALKSCEIALNKEPYNHNYIVIKMITLLQMCRWKESSELYKILKQTYPNQEFLNHINWNIIIQMEQCLKRLVND